MQKSLIVLLLLALALRLAWVLHLPTDDASIDRLPDQREYLQLGRNLLQNHELSFVDPRFADTVYAYRTPGYPMLVAACGGDVRVVRFVQAILDVTSVLAVYLLAGRWVGRHQQLFAAAIVAFNPFLIYFCGLVLSETLFTTLMISGLTLLVIRKTGWLWLAGLIVLALSIQVRPSAIVLPIVMSIIAAFVNQRARSAGTWALAVTVLVLLPWAWRNQKVLGSWIWTTTNSGITLYDGFNPDATGGSDQTFVRTMPQLDSMGEIGRSQYLAGLAWKFIREHPQQDLQLAAIKIARTWSPIPLSEEYGRNPKLIAIALLYMIPLDVLIVLGIWLGGLPRAAKVYLVASAVYFTIVHAGSIGSLRYRVPSDVPMAIIAASSVSLFRRNTNARDVPPVAL